MKVRLRIDSKVSKKVYAKAGGGRSGSNVIRYAVRESEQSSRKWVYENQAISLKWVLNKW